jgi:hypothetical protein
VDIVGARLIYRPIQYLRGGRPPARQFQSLRSTAVDATNPRILCLYILRTKQSTSTHSPILLTPNSLQKGGASRGRCHSIRVSWNSTWCGSAHALGISPADITLRNRVVIVDRHGLVSSKQDHVPRSTVATLTFVLATSVANAQRAPSPPSDQSGLEEITVTGVRADIQSAIAANTSITESISRLPGQTSQRSDGRASDISIRGTDPQFAAGLLNGRQQVSTGDNRNMISRVVVYKTTQATLIGQRLSCTIALEITRPPCTEPVRGRPAWTHS